MRERHTEVIKKRLIWQRSRDENRLASLFGQFHAQHGHGHIVAVFDADRAEDHEKHNPHAAATFKQQHVRAIARACAPARIRGVLEQDLEWSKAVATCLVAAVESHVNAA